MVGKKLHLRSTCYGFLLLLLLSFRPHVTKAQTPIFVGSNCQNTTQQPLNSVYQTNLEEMLRWASSDAATSKGYNYKSIGNNSPVHGLYDCRGDVVGYFCQFCVSTAAKEAPQRCPNRVSAMVWYDFCVLRYSNESFYGTVLTNPSWHALGEKNISNMEDIQKGNDFMRSLIRKATKETNQLFYMDVFNLSSTERRYGLVQCSRDLTNEGCTQCLETILAQVAKCCEHKLGWSIWTGSCVIKYDDYMFYQTSSVAEPNLHIGDSLIFLVLRFCENYHCIDLRKTYYRKRRNRAYIKLCITEKNLIQKLMCNRYNHKKNYLVIDVRVTLFSLLLL